MSRETARHLFVRDAEALAVPLLAVIRERGPITTRDAWDELCVQGRVRRRAFLRGHVHHAVRILLARGLIKPAPITGNSTAVGSDHLPRYRAVCERVREITL